MNRLIDAAIRAVGSPWCVLAFAALALISLPAALATGEVVTIVSWVAQTFLQLVLLAVIQNGQNRQGDRIEQLLRETHDATLEQLDTMRAESEARHNNLARLFGRKNG